MIPPDKRLQQAETFAVQAKIAYAAGKLAEAIVATVKHRMCLAAATLKFVGDDVRSGAALSDTSFL